MGEVVSFGVVLDSTLFWEPQVNHITKKVNRALFGLKFIRSCTTQGLRKRLVESLVIRHLAAWFISMSPFLLEPAYSDCQIPA